jgi:hypothetical protein
MTEENADTRKEDTKENTAESHEENLQKVVSGAQDVLIKSESIFPFVLFPDTIIVSRMKVEIIRRSFFKVSESISLQIEDVLNVEADSGPFFGSLRIYTRIYGSEPLRINYISSRDTKEIKKLIEGAVIAKNNDIDLLQPERDALIKMLRRLGSNEAATPPAPPPE